MITNSLEWSDIERGLIRKSGNLIHSKEMKKLISNIRLEVTELSKAEVDARRGKMTKANELLQKINEDINSIEEFLVVAALLG